MEGSASLARILVVDDEPGVRELLADFLQLEGYRVRVAADGTEAMDELRGARFELIICDLLMPVMGGLAVLDELAEVAPSTSLIAMTGFDTVQTAVEALRRGACDYMVKPFKLDDMNRAVQRAIEHGGLRAPRAKRLS
jgi:DNA-binding NtrC family response regulator